MKRAEDVKAGRQGDGYGAKEISLTKADARLRRSPLKALVKGLEPSRFRGDLRSEREAERGGGRSDVERREQYEPAPPQHLKSWQGIDRHTVRSADREYRTDKPAMGRFVEQQSKRFTDRARLDRAPNRRRDSDAGKLFERSRSVAAVILIGQVLDDGAAANTGPAWRKRRHYLRERRVRFAV